MDVTPHLALRPAPAIVFAHVEARADRPRFMVPDGVGGWSPVTWRAFADQIRDVALGLPLEPGERACIFAPNRVEWLSAALGIQAAGGVMVPIYGSSTAEQAAYVVDHSGAAVVFVDTAALLDRVIEGARHYADVRAIVLLDDGLVARARAGLEETVPALARRVLSWSALRAKGAAVHREDPGALDAKLEALDLDQPALMLYTSGTSGPPKGVPLTHRNVGVNGRDWLQNNAALLEEDVRDLLWLPMSHIFGYGEAGAGNQLGWVSYLSDPKRVMEDLPRVKPRVFMSVPSVWEKIATAAGAAEDVDARFAELTGGELGFCLSGGAGLDIAVKEFFLARGVLLLEGYGLTECSPTLTLNAPDAYRFDSVGRPLPSVELRLADDGEILARGPSVFGGYHEDPAATAGAFDESGWFHTGDLGRFTDDGFLQIIGRKKEILVTAGGKNVAPANIETRFATDPYLAHVVVYGDARKYLVAGVWLHEDAVRAKLDGDGADQLEALVQSRIDRVNAELARFETIKKFRVFGQALTVEDGFLTPTLKLRRKAVYAHFGAALEELYG